MQDPTLVRQAERQVQAALAAFLLGFIHTFTTTIFDAVVSTMVGVAFMALVLVIKPAGLLGRVKQ